MMDLLNCRLPSFAAGYDRFTDQTDKSADFTDFADYRYHRSHKPLYRIGIGSADSKTLYRLLRSSQ